MKNLLSENMRALRMSKKLTQEQLAEAFGVSPQAVSRWENGTALPDISLLPVIANFYEVTSDFLLGIDVNAKQARIEETIRRDEDLRKQGSTEESVRLLREKAKEFPNEPEILHRLACSLYSLYHQSGKPFSENEKKQMANEAISLCSRAVKFSDDLPFICQCKQMMILNYTVLKEYERAREIAFSLPSFWCSREMIYPKTFFGEEGLLENQNFLLQLIAAADIVMGRIKSCDNYTDTQKIELSEVREKIILMLAGENPLFLNEQLFNLAMQRAKIYLSRGNKEKLPEEMKKLIKYAKNYDERKEGGKYEIFWLSLCKDKLGGIKHTRQTLCEILKKFINDNGLKDLLNFDL